MARQGRFLGDAFPPTLWRFILRLSANDQVWLSALAILVAVLDTVPLELQRRIVNHALKEGQAHSILILCSAFAGLVLVQGCTKYVSNMYRAWVSENAVRALREYIDTHQDSVSADVEQGVKVSMVLAESEPLGGFVGDSVSEPVLHAGLMLSVTAYLVYLQPVIAIVIAGVFAPQMVFVPLFQRMINKRAKQRVKVLRAASGGVLNEDEDAEQQTVRFQRVFSLNLSVNSLKYGLNFLMNLSHQFGIAAILGIGGVLVLSGKTQVGTVVAFISGLGTVKDPWGDLVNWYQNLMVTQAKYRLVAERFANRATKTRSER